MEGGVIGRMARLDQGKIEELIKNMKELQRPDDLPDGFLAGNPKKREEFLALVKEMQRMWDYKKGLLDQYHAHGYIEVLVDDENMWGL